MHPDLVIFDCDGVLVDSEPISEEVFREVLAEHGAHTTPGESARFMGISTDVVLAQLEARLGRRLPGFMATFRSREDEAFRKSLRPISGVEQAIDRIVEGGLAICVASSGTFAKMRATLGSTGLLGLFEGRMFSATQVPHGKPHPDLFLFAAAQMGVEPTRCAVVEDSLPGVQGAVAAGMGVLGYAPEGGGAALSDSGAEVFRDMADLPRLLGL